MKPETLIGKEVKIPTWQGIYIVEYITSCKNIIIGQCKKKDSDEKTRYPINIQILETTENNISTT